MPKPINGLNDGKQSSTRSSTHQRPAHREQLRREQYAAIETLLVDVDESDDIDVVLSELKAARKAVAATRRSREAL